MKGADTSEAQLRSIVDAIAEAIVIVDREGVVRFANSGAARLFGKPRSDIIGKPFGFPVQGVDAAEMDIIPPLGGAQVTAELQVAETMWEGEPAMVASLRDITERKRAERHERDLLLEQIARAHAEAAARRTRFLLTATYALSESLDFTATLARLAEICVQYMGDWCVIDMCEPNGEVIRVAVAQLDPAQAQLARELGEISPAQHPLPHEADVLRTAESRILPDFAGELARVRDPRLRTVLERMSAHHALIVPMVVRDRAMGAITIISSTPQQAYTASDVVLAEEMARYAATAVDNSRLFQEAQRGNKAKSNFLAVMSHELRTPLNAIIGYSDLLMIGVPVTIAPEAQQHVARIRSSARHLLRLIEEILTFTRMEAGREQVSPEDVKVHDVANDVAELIQPLAMDRGLEFTVSLPPVDYALRTDAGKLGQILINLLSNAVKFTPSGSIQLDVMPVDDWTHFDVHDSGMGIPTECLDQIFEPFWQAEQTRTRRNEGTGLGLSVARRLAALLGGNLVVQSTLGRGSTFTLQVPNRRPGD